MLRFFFHDTLQQTLTYTHMSTSERQSSDLDMEEVTTGTSLSTEMPPPTERILVLLHTQPHDQYQVLSFLGPLPSSYVNMVFAKVWYTCISRKWKNYHGQAGHALEYAQAWRRHQAYKECKRNCKCKFQDFEVIVMASEDMDGIYKMTFYNFVHKQP